ncbi:uncharacterized protein LOC133318250 [Gastrolobium bilobum]|uniref:uncharacterized protein LOC133318250 n=1 Tax=Gastrolobium bilobum TaxID=150636 RepID=UPI002AAF5BA7|nr:uncharacterized protein LOC133318250 [Gastrolobium bilobum]
MTKLSFKVIPVANRGEEPELTEPTIILYPERNISLHQDKVVLPPFVKKSLDKLRWLLFATDDRELNLNWVGEFLYQTRRLPEEEAPDVVTVRGKQVSFPPLMSRKYSTFPPSPIVRTRITLIYNSLQRDIRKTKVFLPCLITKLCRRAGVEEHPDDTMKVASIIDAKTWNGLKSTYIDTTQPITANLRRSPTRDSEEETSVGSLKKTTKTTPTKSSSSGHVPARRTILPPTKVKKNTPVATDGKQGKKKSPAKPPLRKGERSSQRIKRESEDNEPLAKRLKAGRMSAPKPAAKEKSPSSSNSTFSDIPSPPPAHSPLQQITPQPSPRQQQGQGQKDKEAASAAETLVAEQEAQPQKKNDKGKWILIEPPKKKAKTTGHRQINLGGPLSFPVIRPDTSGDEALARALVEEEGMAIPPLMEEQAVTMPSSSRPPVDEPSTTPIIPPATRNNQQKKQPTSSPTAAIPIAARRKSQIGIAEIFEMQGEKLEKRLPAKKSVPQLDMTSTNA